MSGGFAEIGLGLQAAVRLARGRADGLALITTDTAAEWHAATRSFWAIALCLPAFVALHLLDQAGGARGFAADLAGYVVGWLGFALLTHRLAARLDRAALWPRFITLWNWCNVLQYLMLVVSILPGLLGLPGWLGQTAWLVAMGWALWLEWFTIRVALALPGWQAASLVALDVSVGLMVLGVSGGG
jgi:hypothetical protein